MIIGAALRSGLSCDGEAGRHFHQFRKGASLHLSHDPTAMRLDGNLADAGVAIGVCDVEMPAGIPAELPELGVVHGEVSVLF